ncbi:MAG TPA: hypothetical protein VNI20_02280 [Fimbriimonadaceae bacterium]|nr:hypothetical protein [Fimbriimonadaceae bacterium]
MENIVRDGEKIRTEYVGQGESAGQIAVDDGTWRLQYLPDKNEINKMPSLTRQNSERLEDLIHSVRDHFTIDIKPGKKIADYETLEITMTSDRGFEHKLWVEKRDKAILKREFRGPDQRVGMSYEFQQFKYLKTVDPSEFTINKPGAKVVEPIDRLNSAAAKYGITPYKIVGTGFMLSDSFGFESKDGRKGVRSTYGDGRKILTLVQVLGDIQESRLTRPGDRFNFFVWPDGDYKFALIGDFPKDELKRLSGFVRR